MGLCECVIRVFSLFQTERGKKKKGFFSRPPLTPRRRTANDFYRLSLEFMLNRPQARRHTPEGAERSIYRTPSRDASHKTALRSSGKKKRKKIKRSSLTTTVSHPEFLSYGHRTAREHMSKHQFFLNKQRRVKSFHIRPKGLKRRSSKSDRTRVSEKVSGQRGEESGNL